MHYIGIDIGTTGCKAVITNEKSQILCEDYIEYSLIIPSEKEVEQDAELWWELCCRAVRHVVENSGVARQTIQALSISSQGISFVPIDREGKVLCHAISWLDTRAEMEAMEISRLLPPEEIFRITGKKSNAAYMLPKLLWLRSHRPDIWKRTYKVLMAHDFLVFRMTGNFITDPTMASGTMLYDITKNEWAQTLLDIFEIDIALLPKIVNAGEWAGTLTKDAAERMGLSAEMPVIVGGQDQKVSAYFIQPDCNAATLSLGTAGAMEFFCTKPIFDPSMRLPCFPGILPRQWILEAVVSTTGAALKWLKNTFFSDKGYHDLDKLCESSSPGAGGCLFYPHLEGATSPHWLSESKGFLCGISLETGAEDIVRSVMEGISFQLLENILVFEELASPLREIHAFGGGTKSRVWCQILADITGLRLFVYDTAEIANLGAAKLAYAGCGHDAEAFCGDALAHAQVFEPEEDAHHSYMEWFKRYVEQEALFLNSYKNNNRGTQVN